jgi:hypothetical protein
MISTLTIVFFLITGIAIIAALVAPFHYDKKQYEKHQKEHKKKIIEYIDSVDSKPETKRLIFKMISDQEINVGMTQEMVIFAWGKPAYRDQLKQTKKYTQIRWVYGKPRSSTGVNYVIFRDDNVHSFEQNFTPKLKSGKMGCLVKFAIGLISSVFVTSICTETHDMIQNIIDKWQ